MARGVICSPIFVYVTTMYQFLPCHSNKILLLLLLHKFSIFLLTVHKQHFFCNKTKKYFILMFRDKTATNFEVIVMLPNILSYTTAIYASLQ